jgi:hypothetical protein
MLLDTGEEIKSVIRHMLEYCKTILTKMSFSKRLFRKEYRKTFTYLDSEEHQKLKAWIREKLNDSSFSTS